MMTKSPFHVGMLVYPSITALDFAGPAEVLARAPGVKLHLAWKTVEPVSTGAGWGVIPTTSFSDAPQFDLLCVPGGSGQIALMNDPATLAFLRQQAHGARYITAVCTGSLLLGAAGLLAGYKAACHWMSLDQLRHLGAIPVNERVVIDRNRITGAGVTAGIDFALTVLACLLESDVARAIQLEMEYDPHPPFQSGSPKSCSAAFVDRVRNAAQARQAKRLAATLAAADRLYLAGAPGAVATLDQSHALTGAESTGGDR